MGVVGISACGAGAAGDTEGSESLAMIRTVSPATRPASTSIAGRGTVPAAMPAPTFVLPGPFAILNKRTIFSKTGIAAPPGGAQAKPSPEASMAVRGIVSDDTSFLVFVEDTVSHRTMQLRPGDPVAGGKVREIGFDDFAFESAGAVKRIQIGQNLLGTLMPPVVAASPGPQGPATGPAGAPPDSPPKGAKEPVFEIAPNGQRVRNYVAERAG